MAETRLIHGFHAVLSRLRQSADAVVELYLDEARNDPRMLDLLKQAESRAVRVIRADAKRLDAFAGTARHQGVVAKLAVGKTQLMLDDVLDTLETLAEPALLLVLDGIQDPHNLGASLRVAAALGVHAVVAPRDRAVGINATVSRVASGAAETLPYIVVTNLARAMREIKQRGIWIIGADGEAPADLFSAKLSGPLAWVLGAEGEGLRR